MHNLAPKFSILIGRVSTEDSDRILQTLASLRAQQPPQSYEVLIVDRMHDPLSGRITQDFPEARLELCGSSMTLPQMRARAMDLARGEFVIVTEDHCVPSTSWLADFDRALVENPSAGAIAGCVANGVGERALDWATYLCEYAVFAPPVLSGPQTNLAGMNVVYRRAALEAIDRNDFTRGFWETTVHPLIANNGMDLIQDNRIVINHCKRFSFRLFAAQRFVYSRYFAGIRFPRAALARRLTAAIACVLIPPLMLFRLQKSVRAKPTLAAHARQAAPWLFVFYIIWAVGEAIGYLFGPGKALEAIE